MSKWKLFPIDIYKRGVLIFFGSQQDFKKRIHKESPEYDKDVKDVESDIEGCDAITYNVHTDVIIYAEHVPTIPILMHELSHATLFIMEQVGIDPSTCQEAYAYLFEYLTREVYEWLTLSCDAPLQLSSDET